MTGNYPARLLLQKGLTDTPQRRAIVKVLSGVDEPLTAPEVYRRAKQHTSHLSLPTVYRTLATLKEAGVVARRRLRDDDKRAFFEVAPDAPVIIFNCLGCGKRLTFPAFHVARLRRRLATEFGVAVTEAHTNLGGYCRACLDRPEEVAAREEAVHLPDL